MEEGKRNLIDKLPDVIQELVRPHGDIRNIITSGYHSDVIVTGDKEVIKIVGHKNQSHWSSIEEAAEFGTKVAIYHKKLASISSKLAPQYLRWGIFPLNTEKADSLIMVFWLPNLGNDLQKLIRESIIPPKEAIKLMLDFIGTIGTTRDPNGRVAIGIDAKPANFCLSSDKRHLIHIDFVPPRYILNNGYFEIESPGPFDPDGYNFGLWRFFSIEGMIATFSVFMCVNSPSLWPLVTSEILKWLNHKKETKVYNWASRVFENANKASAIKTYNNFLLLRLSAAKLAYLYPESRSELTSEFHLLTHYESGPVQARLHSARSILLKYVSIFESRKSKPTRKRKIGTNLISNWERAITFISDKNKIDLHEYQVFGELVTTSSQYKTELLYLLNDLSAKAYSNGLETPYTNLICAAPGIGKSTIVKEIHKSLKKTPFCQTDLSEYDNTEQAINNHLQDIYELIRSSKNSIVMACIDEIDTSRNGQYIFSKLIKPMYGKEFTLKKGVKTSFNNLIWLFIASSANSSDEFKKMFSGKVNKAKDFISRIKRPCDLTGKITDPKEKIVLFIFLLLKKAPHIMYVEASALVNVGVQEFETTRDIESFAEKTSQNVITGNPVLMLKHLDIGNEEIAKTIKYIESINPDLLTTTISIKGVV
ncbi:MAG: AAA family ATPase [Candidatus Zixiibacteriota bacterium]